MKNISNYISIAIFLILSLSVHAQVGINETQTPPDPSAMLDVKSSDKGFLTPRMTEVERNAIDGPATGLLIYQTNGDSGFYYNSGLPTSPEWSRIGSEENNPILKDNRIPIDEAAVFGDYKNASTMYAISEPGSYYLTKNIELSSSGMNNSSKSVRGILIDADNVTLDLNGFSMIGDKPSPPSPLTYPVDGTGSGNSSAIQMFGSKHHLTIKNGNISNWQGYGVSGPTSSFNLVQDIHVSNINKEGIQLDNHNLIMDCTAYYSGKNGIEADQANNFIRCRSVSNQYDGIDGTAGSQFINCTAIGNQDMGISALGVGCFVLSCTATENQGEGLRVGSESYILKCNVYDNSSDGIRLSSECTVESCVTAYNEGHGIYSASTRSRILNNVSHENDLSGIYCSGTQTLIQDNRVTDNDDIGIFVVSNDCFVFRNVASGNIDDTSNNGGDAYDNNMEIDPDSNFGPIINVAGMGDISTISGADHPKANFIF